MIGGDLTVDRHRDLLLQGVTVGGDARITWDQGNSCRIEGCEVDASILIHSYGIHLEGVHAANGTIAAYGGEPRGPGAVPVDKPQESRDVAYASNCSALGIVVGGDDVMIHDCETDGPILGFGSAAGIYDSEAQSIEASASAWGAIVNRCTADEITLAGVTNSDVTDCVSHGLSLIHI